MIRPVACPNHPMVRTFRKGERACATCSLPEPAPRRKRRAPERGAPSGSAHRAAIGPVPAAGRVRVGGIRVSGARRSQSPRRRTRKQAHARRTPSSGTHRPARASVRPRSAAAADRRSHRPAATECRGGRAHGRMGGGIHRRPRRKERRAGKAGADPRPGRRAGCESRPATGSSSTGVHSCLLVVGGEAKGVSANKTTADAGPRKLAASNPTAGASTSAEPTVNPSHTMACAGRAGRLIPAQLRSMSLTPPAPSVCLMRRGPCRPLPIAGSDRSCGAGTYPSGVSLRSSTPRA
jgi:hypothetical protein